MTEPRTYGELLQEAVNVLTEAMRRTLARRVLADGKSKSVIAGTIGVARSALHAHLGPGLPSGRPSAEGR